MNHVPTSIGRYEVERLLGEGGMGVLYLARDPVLDRHVALKLLRVNGEDLRRRFMREAQSAARLQHPNIVTVYDVGDHDGQLYIAMEYIDGDTLATLIRDDVPFSAIRKLDIIDEVADGLGFAHQRGIIHRDIKPANLMMSRGGLVKVLDFGIARVAHRESGEIDAPTLIGTPAYMAPEQLEGADVDARSDIYAVGLVMYEFFSGRRAFSGATTAEVLQKVLDAQPTPIERPDSRHRPRPVQGHRAGHGAAADGSLPGPAGDAQGPGARPPPRHAGQRRRRDDRRRAAGDQADGAGDAAAGRVPDRCHASSPPPTPPPATTDAVVALPPTAADRGLAHLAAQRAAHHAATARHRPRRPSTLPSPRQLRRRSAAAPLPAPVSPPRPARSRSPSRPWRHRPCRVAGSAPASAGLEARCCHAADEGPVPVPLPGGAVQRDRFRLPTAGRATVDAPVIPDCPRAHRRAGAGRRLRGRRAMRSPPRRRAWQWRLPHRLSPRPASSRAALFRARLTTRRGIPAAIIVGGLVAMLAICFIAAFLAVRSFGLLTGIAASPACSPAPSSRR